MLAIREYIYIYISADLDVWLEDLPRDLEDVFQFDLP